MVDMAQAMGLVAEIYDKVEKAEADEIFAAFERFATRAKKPGEIERLANCLRGALKGHRELLGKLDFYFPRRYALLTPVTTTRATRRRRTWEDLDDVRVKEEEIPDIDQLEEQRRSQQSLDYSRINDTVGKLLNEVQDADAISVFLEAFDQYRDGSFTQEQLLSLVPEAVRQSTTFQEDIAHLLKKDSGKEMRRMANVYRSRLLTPPATARISQLGTQLELKFRSFEKLLTGERLTASVVSLLKEFALGRKDLLWLIAILNDDTKNCPSTTQESLKELVRELKNIRLLEKNEQRLVLDAFHRLLNNEDVLFFPVEDIDTSALTRCTPSYVQLPPRMVGGERRRSELARSVLNACLKSCSVGTEDTETVHRHLVSEQKMATMETNIWTVELNIARLQSLLKNLQRLSDEMTEMHENNAKTYITREGLGKNAVQTRMLEILYADHYQQILRAVYREPKRGVEVIMRSAKGKLQEWEEVLENERPLWKEVCRKHHLRSLDYTSHSFRDVEIEKNELSWAAQNGEIQQKLKNERPLKNTPLCELRDLQRQLQRPHLTLSFHSRNALHLCGWAVQEGIRRRLRVSSQELSYEFWDTFLAYFLGAHKDPAHSLGHPSASGKGTQSRNRGSNGSPRPLGDGQEQVIFCDDEFYHLFRTLHVLYVRFELLSSLLTTQPQLKTATLNLISSLLAGDLDQDSYEDQLTELVGSEAYPLYTIVDVIVKTVTPMRSLMVGEVMRLFNQTLAQKHDPDHPPKTEMSLKQYVLASGQAFADLDSLRYLMNAKADSRRISFRMAYDYRHQRLTIRKLGRDLEEMPRWKNRVAMNLPAEQGAPVRRVRRPAVFLRRNLALMCSPQRPEPLSWAGYIFSGSIQPSLILERDESKVFYQAGAEDWIVSMRKDPSHTETIEKKSMTMISWLRGRMTA